MAQSLAQWQDLHSRLFWLLEESQQLPSSAPSWDLGRLSTEALIWELEEAEKPFSAQLDATIRAWPELTEDMVRLSGLGTYFLRLRLDASLQLVSQFHLCGRHPESSFLDFPDNYTVAEMIVFLCTCWWHTHGRLTAASSLIVDYHDRQVPKG